MVMMRDGLLESIVLVRFSMGCNSSVSSDIAPNATSKSSKRSRTRQPKGGDESKSEMKKGGGLVLSHGFRRLIRSFKSFFVYKEDKTKHVEKEMEIGFPTDVKHVAHIGLDGSKWEHHQKSADHHQILSLPTVSLQQFELAMAAQSNGSSLA